MKTITITAGEVSLPAELNERTAQQIWAALPLAGKATIWSVLTFWIMSF